MQIQIRFVGSMRNLAGTAEKSVELPEGSTLMTLFDQLRQMLPEAFISRIIHPDLMNKESLSTLITINRKSVSGQEFLEYLLEDGDSIAFVPPMEGG
jgi:molybdopterin converting factor small subunit